MTYTDGITSTFRQTPRLLIAIEPEQDASARIEAASYEDEQRIRHWLQSADMTRVIDAALADLDRRAA